MSSPPPYNFSPDTTNLLRVTTAPITWDDVVRACAADGKQPPNDTALHVRLDADLTRFAAPRDGVGALNVGITEQELGLLRYGTVFKAFIVVEAPKAIGDPDLRFYVLRRPSDAAPASAITAGDGSISVGFRDEPVRFALHFREECVTDSDTVRRYFLRSVYVSDPATLQDGRPHDPDELRRLAKEFERIRFLRCCGHTWDRQSLRVEVAGPMDNVYNLPPGDVTAHMLDRRGTNSLAGNELSAWLPPEPDADRCVVYDVPPEERLRLWYLHAMSAVHADVPTLHLPLSLRVVRGACPTIPPRRAVDIIARTVEEYVMHSARIAKVVLHVPGDDAGEATAGSVLPQPLGPDAVQAALWAARKALQAPYEHESRLVVIQTAAQEVAEHTVTVTHRPKPVAVAATDAKKEAASNITTAAVNATAANARISSFLLNNAEESDVAVTEEAIYAKYKKLWPDPKTGLVLVSDVADFYQRQERNLGLELTLSKAAAEVCRMAGKSIDVSVMGNVPEHLTYPEFSRFVLALAKQ